MATADDEAFAHEVAGRIHAGDPAAERALYAHYGPSLMRMLRALSRTAATAEDIHQETFVIVLSRLRRRPLATPQRLGSFVRRTARILLMANNRKRRRREQQEVCPSCLEAIVDPAPGQLARVLQSERAVLVQRSISLMPSPRYRQLLMRFYLDQEPKDVVCAELGLSSAHFNRVIHRARRGFLRVLERELAKGRGAD